MFELPETTDLYLKLEADFSAKVLDSAEGNPTGEVGHWTMVYD